MFLSETLIMTRNKSNKPLRKPQRKPRRNRRVFSRPDSDSDDEELHHSSDLKEHFVLRVSGKKDEENQIIYIPSSVSSAKFSSETPTVMVSGFLGDEKDRF